MSAADAADEPPPQRPDDIGEIDDLEFLKRGLLLGEGFQLYVGTAPSVDAREAIIRDLQATEGLRVSAVHGERCGTAIEGAITGAFDGMKDGPERPVVVVTDIEQDADGAASLLRRLNERRNELIARVPAAVVVLGGAHMVGVLRKVAPDAWSVRAADLDLSSVNVAKGSEHQPEQLLQPIHPPSSDAERGDLERLVSSLPEGDARGRAAMRLAEVLTFEKEYGREAALFLQAAKEIAEPWSSTLARINAGRALVRSGDIKTARDTLSEALRSEAMRDPSLRGYANVAMASAFRRAGDMQAAMTRIREVLAGNGDRDTMFEAHLEAAWISRDLGDLHAALDELEAAESLAAELRDERLLHLVHLNLGKVAARSGRQSLVLKTFRKVFERRDQGAFRPLLSLIWDLDRDGDPYAAGIAWSALREITEERGIAPDLYTLAANWLFYTLVERPEIHDVASWKARLVEGLPVDAAEPVRGWLDIIDGRSALNAGDVPKALEALGKVFEAEHVQDPIDAPPAVLTTWIGALILSHRREQAVALLDKALNGPKRAQLLSYLAGTAPPARTPDHPPAAEGAVILATFRLMVKAEASAASPHREY